MRASQDFQQSKTEKKDRNQAIRDTAFSRARNFQPLIVAESHNSRKHKKKRPEATSRYLGPFWLKSRMQSFYLEYIVRSAREADKVFQGNVSLEPNFTMGIPALQAISRGFTLCS